MFEKFKKLRGGKYLLWAAAVVAIVLAWVLFMRLPRPPEPGVVATYKGGKVTKEELRRYIHGYLHRCPKHLRCPRHGEEHDSCTQEEQCETFIACDDEHSQTHSLRIYQQAAISLVVDRLIGELVAKKKLSEKKKVRHLMKHITEDINISDLHRDWHKDKIRVEDVKVKEYYEKNQGMFGSRPFSEVAEEIRALLAGKKEEAFVLNYLKELRETSGVSINYDLLQVPEPDKEQLRTAFFERREQFRLPERVKLLVVEVNATGGSGSNEELVHSARTVLLSGASFPEVRKLLYDKGEDIKVTVGPWVSEKDILWKKMELDRYFKGEVTEVIVDEGKAMVARVEQRQDARPQQFEEVREQLAQQVAEELRERHLQENRNATLFTIHGEPYSLGNFVEEFEELPPLEQARYSTFDGQKKLLDKMVERSLVLEDASDNLQSRKNRKQIERVRMAVLKQVLHQEEVDDKISPTDEELRKFFKENSRYYRLPARLKISYILVRGDGSSDEKRAREKAEQALAELKQLPAEQLAGDGFAQVARKYSDDPDVATAGGKVDEWVSESTDLVSEIFLHEFHKNVLSLKKSELSPVFRLGDSFYIVFVWEREEARDREFEEVKELVSEHLMEMKHYELMTNMEADMVQKAGAKIYNYTLLEMLKEEARERKK